MIASQLVKVTEGKTHLFFLVKSGKCSRSKRPTRHSRHQMAPSISSFAELSSTLPHPGRGSLAPLPPHTKHALCHLLACGPETTPTSITETFLRHPGQVSESPKRGNIRGAGGAVCNSLTTLSAGLFSGTVIRSGDGITRLRPLSLSIHYNGTCVNC